MPYKVLSLKWRQKKFDEVIGQEASRRINPGEIIDKKCIE